MSEASQTAASTAETSGAPAKIEQPSRQSNLRRIQQIKQAVLNFPHSKKLLKLSIYSKCQVTQHNLFKNNYIYLIVEYFP